MAERWAWAEIDLDALAHNVEVMRAVVAPAEVWAVVKADGYGHGAVPVAQAALEAGAAGVCVALVDEGVALRDGGVRAPILILSEQPAEQLADVVAHGLVPTVCSAPGIDAMARAASAAMKFRYPVHLKIDTGMHRMGCDPHDAVDLARRVSAHACLAIAGTYTHLAVADDPGHPATAAQLDRFDAVLAAIVQAGIRPGIVHAANSAAGLAHPAARRGLVRAGIALYGLAPGPKLAGLCTALRPVMSLRARVSFVRGVAAGERISYGLRHRFERDTIVATVPVGYADGVPRRLFEPDGPNTGASVVVGGARRPIVGVVTMDQLMVDCGPDSDVAVGDEVVLLGRQDDAEVTATEWAERLGTIAYEVVCGISSRVPRHHRGGDAGDR